MSPSTASFAIGVGHAPCMATHSAPAAHPLRSAAPTSSGSCTYRCRKPALNASPAPVASTTAVG
eukprot:scaffold99909_cov69-Phaeocystis_antarctica.AAC.7